MEENINALDELSKGASMGKEAISIIMDKIKNNEFKNRLKKQYDKYDEISNKICEIYKKYDSKNEPHKTNVMNKMMTWYGIEIKTIADDSDSKLSELLLQGTNMGIIEGRKIINNKKIDKDVSKIADEYVKMQENSVEFLKKYL